MKNRFVIFPLEWQAIWDMYKVQVANFWTPEEIDFSHDYHHFQTKLNDDERHYIKHVLAFFAASDGIVSKNLNDSFIKDAEKAGCLEAVFNYQFQLMMENFHNETYSLMLETLVKDTEERDKLFNAIENVPSVKKKAEWAMKWFGRDDTFDKLPEHIQTHLKTNYETLSQEMKDYVNEKHPSFFERLIAFAAVEGIFFSGSFCAIYWIKSTKKIMPGLCEANEFIARDEGAHTDFACLLYHSLKKDNKLPQATVHAIIKEAVEIEKEFVTEALPVRLINMNATKMCTYIELMADRLLTQLGYQKIWKVKNPFNFIELISMKPKTNFFERRVTDYQRRGVANQQQKTTTKKGLSFSEDF